MLLLRHWNGTQRQISLVNTSRCYGGRSISVNYLTWFVPLCIVVSSFFAITILILTFATLRFRGKINRKYDRRKLNG